ncbi:helix-turn-helix domain-containing protein [Cytobacillus gottheilii]|uniref:helix-turn-helix domain-containing protein n=1 Tax=Cytobacillus gottheilii TaxID=859144 RepID=UPI003CF70CBC
MNKIDAILHPVRFKIVQKFLDGHGKTVKKLTKELEDIPQATLYRQLDALVKSEVLMVTEENQVRGTIEKVYSLNIANANITNDDVKELTIEDHLQYFMIFQAQLTHNFEEYLQKENIDFQRDGVGYRLVAMHLSDEEFADFARDLREVYQTYLQKSPSPERTKRLVSNIFIPENKRRMEDDK